MSFSNVLRLLFFAAVSLVLSKSLTISKSSYESLFGGLALIAGLIQVITFAVINNWVILTSKSDGVNAKARERLFGIAKRGRNNSARRLVGGIFSVLMLRLAASLVDTNDESYSQLWISIGFTFSFVSVYLLYLSITDYTHLTEEIQKLEQVAIDDQKRNEMLETMEKHKDSNTETPN